MNDLRNTAVKMLENLRSKGPRVVCASSKTYGLCLALCDLGLVTMSDRVVKNGRAYWTVRQVSR